LEVRARFEIRSLTVQLDFEAIAHPLDHDRSRKCPEGGHLRRLTHDVVESAAFKLGRIVMIVILGVAPKKPARVSCLCCDPVCDR
jgi:hypothetical protein